MFKKVTTSKNTNYKQCCTYKKQMSYHVRLKESNASDLRNNADFIDEGNGYGKLVPRQHRQFK